MATQIKAGRGIRAHILTTVMYMQHLRGGPWSWKILLCLSNMKFTTGKVQSIHITSFEFNKLYMEMAFTEEKIQNLNQERIYNSSSSILFELVSQLLVKKSDFLPLSLVSILRYPCRG